MESRDLQMLEAHCDLESASGRKCYKCSIFFRHSIFDDRFMESVEAGESEGVRLISDARPTYAFGPQK